MDGKLSINFLGQIKNSELESVDETDTVATFNHDTDLLQLVSFLRWSSYKEKCGCNYKIRISF